MTRLGLLGVGLIGGSIGLAARTAGLRVVGADHDPATLERARGRGAIDELAPDLEALVDGCDVVGICVDVDATVAALRGLRGRSGRARLIFDVASVKAPVVAAGRGVPNFVASHPIAGRERGGIDAADATLFRDASWALVPSGDDDLDARAFAFVRRMGANPIAVGAGVHDAVLAHTSHLPQLVSWALAGEVAEAIAADPGAVALHGPGLASALRTARSPLPLWQAILRANAGYVVPAVRSLAARLGALADAVEAGDSTSLASHSASGIALLDALERPGGEKRPRPPLRSSRYQNSDDDPR